MGDKKHGGASAASLVTFNFHGDELEVVSTPDGQHWVVLARLCAPLGLLPHGQAEKLKAAPWACTQIICVHDASGRKQEVFCINLRSVAGWLFSINAGKVRPELREKLVRYQRECAEVLADHFLGRRGALPQGALDADGVRRLHIQYAVKLSEEQAERRYLSAEVERLKVEVEKALDANSAVIAARDLDRIRRELEECARLMLALGRCRKPNIKSARQTLRNRVLHRWNGAGRALNGMPKELVAEVLATLHVLRREYESELKRRGPAAQGGLFDRLQRHSVN